MACYDSKNPNCGCYPPPPPMPTCCFQGPPGVTGAVGATGATGATGMAATVQVGTTTTGAPGTNASVTNTGTESNAVLNFVIPAGATGGKWCRWYGCHYSSWNDYHRCTGDKCERHQHRNGKQCCVELRHSCWGDGSKWG